jgi:hypothetical protein
MNKLLQVSILFVLALVVVTSAFTVAGTGSTMAAATGCPTVIYTTGLDAGLTITPTFCFTFPGKVPPPFTPNVGWNG